MIITIYEVDLIDLLSLEQILTPGEVEDFLDILNKEVWFRLLHEEVKSKIPEAEFSALVQKYELASSLDPIIEEIEKQYPFLNIERLLNKITADFKREYLLNYVLELEAEKKGQDEGKELVKKAKMLMTKSEFSTAELADLKTAIYGLATSET